ncbi:hypothetical protein LCGC14_0491030 [marine sediment metagenome]|uniref:Uncharacterized protein n=1 Tax=marine sediment metagenome TaxID=412755 RepID=A0A0F9S6J0_9ZZZZ
MAIDYAERLEMAITSKTVSRLYFAALELLEALDEAGIAVLPDEIVLQEPELESVERLRTAVEAYQGEELTNSGSDNKD